MSAPYQALFQSGPDILEDPWPIICAAHHTMDEWEIHLLESNTREAYKLAFRAEMLYNKIVILSPTRFKQARGPYADLLILEHALHYASTMFALVRPENAHIHTSYDLLRTVFVVETSLEIMGKHACMSNESPPPSPHISGSDIRIPTLPVRSASDRLPSCIMTLQLLRQVLPVLGSKYGREGGFTDLYTQLEGRMESLRARIGS